MPRRQRGLTLVELLVAMSLSVVVALAAVAALIVSRRGFTTVDAASELRDNARFAGTMLQRITAQAGFLDVEFATKPRKPAPDGDDLADPPPMVQGFNDAYVAKVADPLGNQGILPRTAACDSAAGGGCSDVLVVRFQAQARYRKADEASSVPSDRSMIDCTGTPMPYGPENRDDMGISVFYVAQYRNEPALMCIAGYQHLKADGTLETVWAKDERGKDRPTPVVQGVENFQVLYGTDGVDLGNPLRAADTVPDRYLRADQLTVGGTNQYWRRVRSLRIGMVLRGPPGSQQEQSDTQMLYPFGAAPNSTGDEGSFLSSDDDRGTRFRPIDQDQRQTRLRQTSSFTVYLHNDQGLCAGDVCAVQ